jgi:hypothetical protein
MKKILKEWGPAGLMAAIVVYLINLYVAPVCEPCVQRWTDAQVQVEVQESFQKGFDEARALYGPDPDCDEQPWDPKPVDDEDCDCPGR